jgi:hypothetical protein
MTTAITLEALGFTKDDLQERVIERLCEQILAGKQYDEDGNEEYDDSQFKKKLEERLRAHITETVNAIAERHVLPNVTGYIENLVLQTTTSWGEKVGKPVTFIEYLVQRAEAYIQEEVNYEGKSKSQDTYNWSKKSTRITFLIEKHLHYHIETAMKQALQTANSAIAGGIEKAVKINLEQLINSLKVSAQVKG